MNRQSSILIALPAIFARYQTSPKAGIGEANGVSRRKLKGLLFSFIITVSSAYEVVLLLESLLCGGCFYSASYRLRRAFVLK